jgi:predicted ATPase/DNA-binding CsgD family transcriptional regulator
VIERLRARHEALSARQSEIALLVAVGRTTREIADELHLSPRTVETHIGAIFNKIGVRSRTELAAAIFDGSARVEHPGNVPLLQTALIGRERDVAAIAALHAKHRLVTIVGTGGVGKTQTALSVVREAPGTFADGTWFVDLGALESGEYIPATIAQLLGIALSAPDDQRENLVRRLRSKNVRFVFDNCEHVVRSAAAIASAILRECSSISIIATSRQPLDIQGERTYQLPALAVPGVPALASIGVSDAPRYSALALFIERARLVDTRFELTDKSIRAIGEICRRLDGVPLAIELAAARSNLFTPEQLVARIEDRFELLGARRHSASPRHQNMRALIDWSYDYLTEGEKRLFHHLSIFAGSFTLDAAVAVSQVTPTNEYDVIERLSSLIDKSLVSVERESEALRYRLLESTRAYAREKLNATPEQHDVENRHLRYLATHFSNMQALATRDLSEEVSLAFAVELPDIRAALDAAWKRKELVAAGELLATIGIFWETMGLGREGIERIETFVAALADDHPLLVTRLLDTLAELHWQRGNRTQARTIARRSLAHCRRINEASALITALLKLAVALLPTQLDEVEALLGEAEVLCRSTLAHDANAREVRARFELCRGELDRAEDFYHRLLAENRSTGNQLGESTCLLFLSIAAFERGALDKAVTLSHEAIGVYRNLKYTTRLAGAIKILACFLCAAGDLRQARIAAADALTTYAAIDPQSANAVFMVEVFALIDALEGEVERAATLQAFTDAALARHGFAHRFMEAYVRDRLAATIAAALPQDRRDAAALRGLALSADAAVALAQNPIPT